MATRGELRKKKSAEENQLKELLKSMNHFVKSFRSNLHDIDDPLHQS